mmetsp:Transcript_2554/g.4641  ORF Transcript_2554/g.4641 Transcript_2554/m.4641 type:complete len:285 (-) Transcript_2554:46-900(-)
MKLSHGKSVNNAIIAVLALASPAIAFQSQSVGDRPIAFLGNKASISSPFNIKGLPSLSLSPHQAYKYGSSVSVLASSAKTTAEDEVDIFEEAEAIFDCVDVNQDGVISPDELRHHLVNQMGYSTEYTNFLFESIDMDSDGELSRQEFRFAFYNFEAVSLYMTLGVGGSELTSSDAFQNISKQMSWESRDTLLLDDLADMIFDMIDTDESGEIDASELQAHFDTVTAKLGTDSQAIEYVNDIMTVLDANKDGVIERGEMRVGFRKYDFKFLAKTFGLRVFRQAEV